MEKQDVISVIKDVVKKFRKNLTLDIYYLDKVIFCGEDIVVGIDIKEHNDGDIFLLSNPLGCVGEYAMCYNVEQLMRFCGRLIAYVNGEPSRQSDEHYEWLVQEWFERHNRQEVFVVTSVKTSGSHTPLSNRIFRNEDDAYAFLNSIIKSWKEVYKGCNYETHCGYLNHKNNYAVQEFYGDCEDGSMVHYTLNKIEVK